MSKYTQEDLEAAKLHHNRTRECPLVRHTAQLIADTREAERSVCIEELRATGYMGAAAILAENRGGE